MGSWRGDRAIFWGQSLLLLLSFYARVGSRAVIPVTYPSDALGCLLRDHRHRAGSRCALSLSLDMELRDSN